MAKGDILLSIPFNEKGNAATAPDQASGLNPARITGGQFVTGRYAGRNAVTFTGVGRAEVLTNKSKPFLPTSGVYTLCMWLKATQVGATPTASWMLFKFAAGPPGGADRFVYLDLRNTLTTWTYFALTMETTRVSVYLNAQLIETRAFPTDWGKPTGWCILNDNPSDRAGFSTLQDLTIYDGVADLQLISPPIAQMDLNYSVNGVDFKDYGVYVSESEGTIEKLAMKEPFAVEWDEHHGEVLDLSRPRFQPREIKLSCFIQGVGKDEFLSRVQKFMGEWTKPGTQRLHLSVLAAPQPLVYEVYCKESVTIQKRWSDALMVGTFEVNLREPQPIKRVLKAGGIANANMFDKTKVVEGQEVRPDGTFRAQSTESITGYIPVTGGVSYTVSGLQGPIFASRHWVFLAADKTTILQNSAQFGSAGQFGPTGHTITSPAGAAYLVFSLKGRNTNITNYDTVKVEIGSAATAYVPYGGTYSITLTSAKALDIYWGDGTSSRTIYGTNRTVTHTYDDAGRATRYIIIAGVIEDITAFTTNCEVVWNKL